ncbi:putative immunity protein [Saccharopolyspora rosea]|uniref:Immunity protein n=1 Tax=Saccharopolyspora rosea TaxID=524884 RepID=A0ABW3FJP2_9PSEU|nr:exonuclease SbcC [Saccharopolyspora rosea]
MGIVPGDFELTMDELRVVARYAVDSAEEVLSIFEQVHPDDRRPRAAVEAAWIFAGGANRTMLQRTAALDAHRAAKDATTEAAKHAAHAAGDAASAAYLHPIAKATQVGHILRAAAHAARAAELSAGGDPSVGDQRIERARQRALPALVDVLGRYPPAPAGKSRVAQLMQTLDASLRSPSGPTTRSGADHGGPPRDQPA